MSIKKYLKFVFVLIITVLLGTISVTYTFLSILPKTIVEAAGCPTNTASPRYDGLLTAPIFPSPDNRFYGKEGQCVVGDATNPLTQASIDQSNYSYDNLARQFYDLAKGHTSYDIDRTPVTGAQTNPFNTSYPFTGKDKIYRFKDNVTITANISGSTLGLVFIDGSLNIESNIDYSPGLVFIVKGNINISPNVTTIKAVLIAEGTTTPASNYSICTNYQSGSCTTPAGKNSNKLTVEGSLISIGSNPILFKRDAQNSTDATITKNQGPVEVVNAQPKYLAILRYLMPQNISVITEDVIYVP